MTNERGTADDRHLANLIIAPDRQFRIAILAGGIGLAFFFGFFAFQIWIFSALIRSLTPIIPQGSDLERMIADSIRWSWILFGIVGLSFTVVFSGAIFLISHRIFGPVVAIRKHLAAIARGEYDHRTHLRKNDEFKDIAKDLNHVSTLLEAKLSQVES